MKSDQLLRATRTTPAIRLDSHLALFAPANLLETLVPSPLYLLEFFRGTLRTSYEQDATGHVAAREDYEQLRTIRYDDGLRCSVRVEGSRVEGLPTQNDVDYLLALFRMCDAGAVREDGTFVDPSYRSISIAAGRGETPSGPQVEAVKRALRRWAHVRISTSTEIDFHKLAAELDSGRVYPIAPDGFTGQREFEATHHVLDYEVETETRDASRRDNIRLLRLDPVWLDQMAVGITTWIDVELHNRLSSGTAKRLYQVLAIRAARGMAPPHVWTLDELVAELGIRSEQKASKVVAMIRAALTSLQEEGILRGFEVERATRRGYAFMLHPGDALLTAGLLRGVGSSDQARTRAILWHLRRHGVPIELGRSWLYSRPTRTLAALRHAYFLQLQRNGIDQDRIVESWSDWLRDEVEGGRDLDGEPGYSGWVARVTQEAVWRAAEGEAEQPRVAEPALVTSGAAAPRTAEARTPGLYPALAYGDDSGDRRIAVELRLEQLGCSAEIGAFDAELAYDPAEVTFVGGASPENVIGAWSETAPGILRLAGVASRGLGPDDPLALLRFEARSGDAGESFRVRFLELARAGDYGDLTPLLPADARAADLTAR